VGDTVLIRTLFWQKSPEQLLTVRFSELSGKRPLSVRISNRDSSFLQAVAPDFAIQCTTADLESPSCFMFVPVGFLEHSENQPPLVFGKRGGGWICGGLLEELRQMPSLDHRILGENNSVAYGVFQLADIAGPVVIHEELHSTG